jgi:hypothetical protein
MPIPELLVALVEKKLGEFCESKVPPAARVQVQLKFRLMDNTVELYEYRVAYDRTGKWIENPIAQFRYSPSTHKWTLYCRDRNCRWHQFRIKPDKSFENLLTAVQRDSTGIFWG